MELLGLAGSGDADRHKNEALNDLWATYEIGGVALLHENVTARLVIASLLVLSGIALAVSTRPTRRPKP